MGWFDVVAGVATGGLYTVGKAIYQAGNAAEDAGEAAEEAGMAIAVIGSTIQAVGEQLNSTLKEAEELLTIQRLTPRSEADLWDEEKERLDSLRQEKTRLENKLKENGVTDTGNFDFNFWDIISDFSDVIEKFQLMAKLATANQEIHDIFYQEPGVVTTGIYNAKEVLERLNTIEQPMIEDILASLDDNLDVTEEVLKEVKKLFVTKRKVPVSITELSPSIRDQLDMIQTDKLYYEGLISRKDTVTAQLGNIIKIHPENKFEIAAGAIKVPKDRIYASSVLDDVINATDMFADQTIGDQTIGDQIKDNIDVADIIDKENINVGAGTVDVSKDVESVRDNIDTKDTVGSVDASTGDRTVRNIADPQPTLRTTSTKNIEATGISANAASINKERTNISAANIARLATSIKAPGNSMSMMQPYGAKISASLSTKFDGYQRNYDLMKAQKAFYFRQSLKMERKYELLSNKWEEVPGVIPQTLDELHGVLENIRTEEQPRIDLLLDNVNATLVEAQGTVEKANDTMDSVKNALSILDFDTKYLKLGGMVIGGLIVLDLFVGSIVLIRMALGS
ncbi:hypothetical protein [Methanolobus profundi]|uniref:Uncharacterized protein n=1 Tax=Methanolobus profundi TaxID=487685 RepID=A0A1I4NRJ2_9EURY|nr:hypothetical protein [Methanolobus profundi]SFM18015.1 hypothetical protein SAMN04488696_0216 [Methanolobus profundi]